MAIEVTSQNYEDEVTNSDMPVIIDFWAPWCGPCRTLSPIVDELAQELEGSVKVVKINVDDEPDIASRFGVMSIPTLALIKDGELSATSVGARGKEDIKEILGL